MPDIFHETTVAKSRKDRVCSWCGSAIEIGKPYRGYSWRDGGDVSREEMHPECYDAMCDEATAEGAFITWSIGDYHRGCRCANGDCQCD